MGFFYEASNFTVEGNQPPPNVPQLMAEVEDAVHRASAGLPSGCHFQGVVQPMDASMSRYLEAELAQKDACLQAMKERKARKAGAARLASMQYPSVGYSGNYDIGNVGLQAMVPPQMPLGLPSGPQQVMDPMMLPSNSPVDFSFQGAPFAPPQMNIPRQEFPPCHQTWDGNPKNPNDVHGSHWVQGASEYHAPLAYPPLVQHRQPPYPQAVDSVESDEAEIEEQFPAATNDWSGPNKSARTKKLTALKLV